MFQVWVEYNGHWLFVDQTSDHAADYALAFMADVNWYEIAGNLISTLEAA